MVWEVRVHKKVYKQIKDLPSKLNDALSILIEDIEVNGPVRGNWPNYSKLRSKKHHCHLRKGHPTYIAIWEEVGDKIQLVEVTYVGTHEKVPY